MSKLKFDWSLIENRSELGRNLLAERLFSQNKKNQLMAYICLFFLGGMGLHRMYLGLWKSAATLAGFTLVVLMSPILLAHVASQYPEGPHRIIINTLPFIVLLVMLYEIIRLFFLVRNWNAELKQEIETKMVFI